MATGCTDSDGNEIPCPDDQSQGAPPTSAPDAAPPPDFAAQSINDPSRGAPAPTNWSTGGTWSPTDPQAFGNTFQPGPTPGSPSELAGGAPPPGAVDTSALAAGPAPGTPGGVQAPVAPAAPAFPKFPDYSGIYQAQLQANAAAQKALIDFEQKKWGDEFGLKQQQFGLDTQKFGLEQSKFDTAKQQFKQEFDLKTTIAKAEQAYKEALIRTQDMGLAQQAMRDSMTREFQTQELGFRNQQLAQQSNIEREKLDLQRRLLPTARTSRRGATVTTI